jgi:hypothetical protein
MVRREFARTGSAVIGRFTDLCFAVAVSGCFQTPTLLNPWAATRRLGTAAPIQLIKDPSGNVCIRIDSSSDPSTSDLGGAPFRTQGECLRETL